MRKNGERLIITPFICYNRDCKADCYILLMKLARRLGIGCVKKFIG